MNTQPTIYQRNADMAPDSDFEPGSPLSTRLAGRYHPALPRSAILRGIPRPERHGGEIRDAVGEQQ
jgi:hypothetical protein